MSDLYISIVLCNTGEKVLQKALNSILKARLNLKVFFIDNSQNEFAKELSKIEPKIEYIRTGKNLGYGKAHNIALKKSVENNIKYHLVMNPDVYFEEGTLEELYSFMEAHKETGLIMPKVLYPDGSLQYLCKLLPTPFDLIGRRFMDRGPFKKLVEKRNSFYELRFTGYDRIINVPFLSGCFMFIRTEVLKKAGFFDERFFLYCDDLDLSRRIHSVSKTFYYPYCYIYHEWGRDSYKSLKLLLVHIRDAVKYFNKWGWFKDKERDRINKNVLKELKNYEYDLE